MSGHGQLKKWKFPYIFNVKLVCHKFFFPELMSLIFILETQRERIPLSVDPVLVYYLDVSKHGRHVSHAPVFLAVLQLWPREINTLEPNPETDTDYHNDPKFSDRSGQREACLIGYTLIGMHLLDALP